MSPLGTIEDRIEAFKKRMETELEFCRELFDTATVRLLSHKYAYYVEDNPYIDDLTYDGEEKTWFVMGRALGLLKEDEISPCVGFDEKHPMAAKGAELAKKLMRR